MNQNVVRTVLNNILKYALSLRQCLFSRQMKVDCQNLWQNRSIVLFCIPSRSCLPVAQKVSLKLVWKNMINTINVDLHDHIVCTNACYVDFFQYEMVRDKICTRYILYILITRISICIYLQTVSCLKKYIYYTLILSQ